MRPPTVSTGRYRPSVIRLNQAEHQSIKCLNGSNIVQPMKNFEGNQQDEIRLSWQNRQNSFISQRTNSSSLVEVKNQRFLQKQRLRRYFSILWLVFLVFALLAAIAVIVTLIEYPRSTTSQSTVTTTTDTTVTTTSTTTSTASTTTTTSTTSTSTSSTTTSITTSTSTSTTSTTTSTTTTSTSTVTVCSAVGHGSTLSLNYSDPASWTQYSFNYSAVYISTTITFAFETEGGRTYYLDNVSAVDVSATNIQLLDNPSFENSTTQLNGWTLWCNPSCGGSGGSIATGSHCYSSTGNCFSDNCPNGINFLFQSFSSTIGNIYTISFRLIAVGGGGGGTTGSGPNAQNHVFFDIN